MADKVHRTRFELSAVDQATRVFQSVGKGLGDLKAQYAGFAAAGSALFAAGGIAAFVTDAARYRAALDDIADTTGDNVRTLDGLARQYKITTGSIDGFSGSLAKLAKNLNNADDDGKAAAAAIAALGLNLTDLQAKKPGEAMLDIALALGKFEDGASKVAVATALMGKEGAKMLPFLKDLAEAGELHGKITAEEAAQAERLEKEWRKLQQAFADTKQDLASGLIPYFGNLLEQMREGIRIAGGFGAALRLFGMGISPGQDIGASIAEKQAALEKWNSAGAIGRFFQKPLGAKYSEVGTDLQKQIDFLKFVQRQEAMGLAGPGTLDARDLMARQKPLLDFKPTEKRGSAGKEDKTAADYAKSLQMQKDMLDEANKLGAEFVLNQDKAREALKKEAEALRDLVDPGRVYLHDQEKLNKLLEEGIITREELVVMQRKLFESKNGIKDLGETASVAADAGHAMGLSFTSSLERVIFDTDRAVHGMDILKAAAMDVAKVIYGRNVAEPLAGAAQSGISALWQSIAGGSNAYVSGTMTAESAGMLPFAAGGVMTPYGSVPLRRYASGGVATAPQMALFGEGDTNEAYVPLPDGRRIPVHMQGGGDNYFIDARGADRGVEARLTAMIKAQGAAAGRLGAEEMRRRAYRAGQRTS